MSQLIDLKLLLYIGFLCAASSTVNARDVIVTVDEERITYDEIQSTHESMELYLNIKEGDRLDELPFDEKKQELESLKHNYEIESLAQKIWAILYENEVERLNVTVSQQELDAAWLELTKDVDERRVNKQVEYYKALLGAIEGVTKGELDKEVVYQSRLSQLMTDMEWEVHLSYFSQENRIDILKKEVSKLSEGNYGSSEDITSYMVDKKLNEAINREIEKSDSNFAKYRKSMANDEGRIEYLAYIDNAKANWWKNRVKKADIQVLDKRFEDVWYILLQKRIVSEKTGWFSDAEAEKSYQDNIRIEESVNRDDMAPVSSASGRDFSQGSAVNEEVASEDYKTLWLLVIVCLVFVLLILFIGFIKKSRDPMNL